MVRIGKTAVFRGFAVLPSALLLLAGASAEAAAASDQPPTSASGTQPVEPGEQYPPRLADQATRSPPAQPQRRQAEWRLTVDLSVTADSNVNNATDADTIELDLGGVVLPVPLDPTLRERSGVGRAVSASLSGRIPIAPALAVALDAEGYALDQDGGRSDDSSLLLAAGAEIGASGGPTGLVQVTAFTRDYGGRTAMEGVGLRARYAHPLGGHRRITLLVDARIFKSDYGEDFEGTEGGIYLGYETPLSPTMSASLGLFGRGTWLGADAYSSREFGAYGGLSTYVGDLLVAGATTGLSRVEFDGAIALLDPDPRRDWRWYASAYLTTRRPILIGITPSLTYTYGHTGSSILFYQAERHRLRLGLSRTF
jgi:hypothetical protein